MFDTYLVSRQLGRHPVSVTEKRAPTDQSVALLKEMEAAARAKVVEAVRVENNSVKAIFQRYEDAMNAEHVYGVFYRINGEKREVVVRDHRGRIVDVAEKLWRSLADDIAVAILKDIAK